VWTFLSGSAKLDGLALVQQGFQFKSEAELDPNIAAAEAAYFGALEPAWHSRIAITYRRRERNAAFKAGNIRDFCERWARATISRWCSTPTA